MADTPNAQVWIGRTVFAVIALVMIFGQLLPLDMSAAWARDPFAAAPDPLIPLAVTSASWAGPDLLLVTALVWVARRPDLAPVLLIAAIFLLCDLLFQRPPGLWAALVLTLTEVIRSRAGDIRNMPLALEWGTVAVGIVAITVANRALLTIAVTPQAPLGLTLIQMILTILSYPLVVLAAHFLFGVSRTSPGQVNSLGHRL